MHIWQAATSTCASSNYSGGGTYGVDPKHNVLFDAPYMPLVLWSDHAFPNAGDDAIVKEDLNALAHTGVRFQDSQSHPLRCR